MELSRVNFLSCRSVEESVDGEGVLEITIVMIALVATLVTHIRIFINAKDAESTENAEGDIKGSLSGISPDSLGNKIEKLSEYYDEKAEDYEFKHKISRRLSVLSLYMALFGIIMLGLLKMADVVFTTTMIIDLVWSLVAISVMLTIVCLPLIGNMDKNVLNILSYIFYIILVVISPVLIFWILPKPLPSLEFYLIVVSGVGGSLSVILYLSNRLFGYTRAWSRNRTVSRKLRMMKAKYAYMKCGQTNAVILKKIDDQISGELFESLEAAVGEEHLDLVKDYLFFGDSIIRMKFPKVKG